LRISMPKGLLLAFETLSVDALAAAASSSSSSLTALNQPEPPQYPL
jgi:hypothetical protein